MVRLELAVICAQYAYRFNQPLAKWDVSRVKNFKSLFLVWHQVRADASVPCSVISSTHCVRAETGHACAR